MYEIYCRLRDAKGLKDADIARQAQITKSTLSEWKSGRSKPKLDKMQRIADVLGVTVDYLMTGGEKEEKTSPTNYDVAKGLTETLDHLSSDNALMFNGLELNGETRRLLKSSLQIVIENALMTSEANKKG